MTKPFNPYSSKITPPISRGECRAMRHATDLTETDMDKTQVGISSVWYERNPGDIHLGGFLAGAIDEKHRQAIKNVKSAAEGCVTKE
jgi:dihydroxyacid dehydratase/phosphogluconate dehydratase